MTSASGTGMAVLALTGLLMMPAVAQENSRFDRGQQRLRLSYGNGESLLVELVADGRSPMPFEREASGVWAFRGDTASLVGKSYTIRLENTGRSRIKVVVGVDGVNVYFRKPLGGSADRDIGSILGPGQTRVLAGFQADEQTAQRFVFSPPEFSEGVQVRGGRIGEIDVQIYEEARAMAGRSPDRATTEARPEIGTTAGEDVDSEVRRVSFTASSREPVARMLLVYGRPGNPDREPSPENNRPTRLGIEVDEERNGLRIVRVERGRLGDELGLREGDVITKVDTSTRPTLSMFQRILRDKGRGAFLFLEVLRGRGHVVNFKIRL